MDRQAQKKPEEAAFFSGREWQPVLCALAAAALLHVLFMVLSGKWLLSPNAYNSYVRQAAAWLEGRLYLSENVPWLELAVYQGRYYVSFPPFPSYVMLPFVLLYGESAPDHLVAFAAMLLGAGYAVKLARQMGLSHRSSAAFAVFLYCANNLWQITVDGWVWFIAQNFAFTLTVMALYYGACGKKGRAFFFLCAAVGCRPFQILYIPVLCWLLLRERKKRQNGSFGKRITGSCLPQRLLSLFCCSTGPGLGTLWNSATATCRNLPAPPTGSSACSTCRRI